MFRVDLVRLDRDGTQAIGGVVPPDDPFWGELDDERPSGPVEFRLALSSTPTGQVLARGSVKTRLERDCRRCLRPVEVMIDEPLDLVWSVPDELEGEEKDGEIRWLDPVARDLDLTEALREEYQLVVPRFVLCSEGCRGLCPRCGIDRNEETCECTLEEPDPRWEALRALQNE